MAMAMLSMATTPATMGITCMSMMMTMAKATMMEKATGKTGGDCSNKTGGDFGNKTGGDYNDKKGQQQRRIGQKRMRIG